MFILTCITSSISCGKQRCFALKIEKYHDENYSKSKNVYSLSVNSISQSILKDNFKHFASDVSFFSCFYECSEENESHKLCLYGRFELAHQRTSRVEFTHSSRCCFTELMQTRARMRRAHTEKQMDQCTHLQLSRLKKESVLITKLHIKCYMFHRSQDSRHLIQKNVFISPTFLQRSVFDLILKSRGVSDVVLWSRF